MTHIAYIPFAFPGVPGVRCAFHHRVGAGAAGPKEFGNISFDVGDAPDIVLKNREALQEKLGFRAWAELKQTHGDVFIPDAVPTPLDHPGVVEADGHATDVPGLALLIKTADCQPILLAHEDGAHVAALHAGWRGNRLEFPISGVRAFCRRFGFSARELFAVRGPSLGPDRAEFVNAAREWPAPFLKWHNPETKTMDLWGLTSAQLREAGLLPERIFGIDRCTLGNPEDFFSHRGNPASGRQASLIWIEGEKRA